MFTQCNFWVCTDTWLFMGALGPEITLLKGWWGARCLGGTGGDVAARRSTAWQWQN